MREGVSEGGTRDGKVKVTLPVSFSIGKHTCILVSTCQHAQGLSYVHATFIYT